MKKSPGFFEGVSLALVASIFIAAGFFTLSSVFASISVFRLLVAVIALAYVIYLLLRSHERTGRIIVISAWLLIAGLNWLFNPSLLLYLLIHLVMIWLIRSLYYYNSILSSILDAALTSTALMIAIWSWSSTHSLFLSFWCFFLVQALFVLIPHQIKKTPNHSTATKKSDAFERAHQAAEYAVRKLTISR